MNRENKYRAWDKEDKRMIIDTQDFIPLVVTNKGVLKLSPLHEENLYSILPIDRFELMQSTGIKDKNKNEIYVGDILKLKNARVNLNNDIRLADVKWGVYCDDEYVWNCECFVVDDIPLSDIENGSYGHSAYEIEIVGNIYENEELLTNKE